MSHVVQDMNVLEVCDMLTMMWRVDDVLSWSQDNIIHIHNNCVPYSSKFLWFKIFMKLLNITWMYIFVIATFFRDYRRAQRPRGQVTLSLHPQFLHVALFVSAKEKKLEITMTRFKLQSSVNLSGHPSYRRLLTFVTVVKERTYIHVHVLALRLATALALTLVVRHALHST